MESKNGYDPKLWRELAEMGLLGLIVDPAYGGSGAGVEELELVMEEIGAARGAAELSPVLHRFAAYLEALSSQVNMRAVLLDHPFDYPEIDE